MSKKLYSKDHYYQPIICEICNRQTDIIHTVHVYHSFPEADGRTIIRPTFKCFKCFANSGLKSSKQIWIPVNRSTGRSSHFIERNEKKEDYHGSFN